MVRPPQTDRNRERWEMGSEWVRGKTIDNRNRSGGKIEGNHVQKKKLTYKKLFCYELYCDSVREEEKTRANRRKGNLDCTSQYSNQCWSTNEMCSNQRKPIKALVIKDSLFISGLTPNCPLFKVLTQVTRCSPFLTPSSQWVRQVGGMER